MVSTIGMDKKQPIKSSILKSGKRTYFFDIYAASNGNKYLKVTESTFEGEGKTRRYNSFLLFSDQVQNFQNRLSEMVGELA